MLQINMATPPIVTNEDTKDDSNMPPPLISFKVTNPVTYLKKWWKQVMSSEGVDLRFRIHPITAIALALVLVAGGAGAGFILKTVQDKLAGVPIVKDFLPTPTPSLATPNPWRDTAYTGVLKETGDHFYLVTSGAEAITLEVPANVDLTKFLGKRILAVGSFNSDNGVLVVRDATDMEVLIQSTAVPTTTPIPSPVVTPEPMPLSNPET